MAGRRGRFTLSPPRLITFALSLALVLLALAASHVRLPVGERFVLSHRFWIAVAAYVVLALGTLLPGI